MRSGRVGSGRVEVAQRPSSPRFWRGDSENGGRPSRTGLGTGAFCLDPGAGQGRGSRRRTTGVVRGKAPSRTRGKLRSSPSVIATLGDGTSHRLRAERPALQGLYTTNPLNCRVIQRSIRTQMARRMRDRPRRGTVDDAGSWVISGDRPWHRRRPAPWRRPHTWRRVECRSDSVASHQSQRSAEDEACPAASGCRCVFSNGRLPDARSGRPGRRPSQLSWLSPRPRGAANMAQRAGLGRRQRPRRCARTRRS